MSKNSCISNNSVYDKYMVSAKSIRGCPRSVMVKAIDSGIVVSEFVLQLRCYIHFRANTPGKGSESPYPPSYGLNSTTTVLIGECIWY